MPLRRAMFVMLLCASAAWAGDVNTLKQGLVSGDIVSVSDKEVVLNQNGKEVKIPIDDVLQIDFAAAGRPKPDDKYSDVELICGTVLHCSSFLVKKDNAVFTVLTTGQEVTTPLLNIANVLTEANIAKNRKDWDERLTRNRKKDVYVKQTNDKIAAVEGTFTEGTGDGTEIGFTHQVGDETVTNQVALAKTYGIIFSRGVNDKAKPVICKMTDAQGNMIYVSAVKSTPAEIEIETSCGVKLVYKPTTMARLDYTNGKIAYLADLKPSNLVETSPFDTIEHYQINRNLDGGPLKLEGKTYSSGLSVHAYTELEYDLKGEYREFRAILGMDDQVGGHDGPIPVVVVGSDKAGNDKELARFVVDHKERGKTPKVLTINIKDVQKLKIKVGNGDLQDIGKHVDLADAKVTK